MNDSTPVISAATAPTFLTTVRPWWRAAVETLLVFGVFALHGAWPVPDVNEPHYLSKAKHYWNPDWCRAENRL